MCKEKFDARADDADHVGSELVDSSQKQSVTYRSNKSDIRVLGEKVWACLT